MQECIEKIVELLDESNPDWKEILKTGEEGLSSSLDETTRNHIGELILTFRKLLKDSSNDYKEVLNQYFDDPALVDCIIEQVKQTLVYYNSFAVLRELEQADCRLVSNFIEDIFRFCLLRFDIDAFEKYSFSEKEKIENVVWAFDNLTDYYVRRLFTQNNVQQDFQNETGLSDTNTCLYARLYENNFAELRLNTILNMLHSNQERLKQLERILIEE